MKRWGLFLLLLMTTILLAACGSDSSSEEKESQSTNESSEENMADSEPEKQKKEVSVMLKNKDGDDIGTADLAQKDGGVQIDLKVSDIPEGTHGFHIHETGSCEAPDFKSAGGHFNPTNASHGAETEDGPHAGDMANIEVSSDGMYEQTIMNEKVTLESGKENSLLKDGGTALVIHAGADDQKSQPSGDAGERIACGVISE